MGALALLRNGRIADFAEPHDLLVAGGKVALIDRRIDLHGVAFDVVDLDGRHVVPGLVDAHVHLTGGGGEAGFKTRVPRIQRSQLVRAGVTTAIGVLGTDGVTRTMRDLVACTLALREEGLSAWCYTGNYAVPVLTLTGSVKDDIAFVDPVLGVGELALSDHRSSQPTFEELLRIASDAYVAGLSAGKPGVMHLHLGDGPRGLDLVKRALETELPARLWQPTHLNRNPALWAEAKALAASARRLPYFDVTAFPPSPSGLRRDRDIEVSETVSGEANEMERSHHGANPKGVPRTDDRETLSAADAVLDWLHAGLPAERLSVSSDGGGCLPTFDGNGRMTAMDVGTPSTLLDTVRALVLAGLPLGRAVAFVAAHPAKVLGLDAHDRGAKGRIAAGGDADLLVLDEALALTAVMAQGRWLMRDGEVVNGMFEAIR